MRFIFNRLAPWHAFLYRLTGGRLLLLGKTRVLLLNTIGRRSGQQRTTPVMYYRDGQDYVVVASAAGQPRHPGWYYNLKHRPEITIQVGSQVIPVTAELVQGDTRTRLWRQIVSRAPALASVQEKTRRNIGVFRLRARDKNKTAG